MKGKILYRERIFHHDNHEYRRDMREDPKSLADRFFEKETTNNIDFEITFAALLSTLVLTYR